jgi:hypothetical protein
MNAVQVHASNWASWAKGARPGSLRFLFLLFVAGALFAWAWTRFGYTRGNLERQGIDIVHHALMVHAVSQRGGVTPQSLGIYYEYPLTSHRLAAPALPLFGNDPILAMRFAAMSTIVWLLALQFTLLCRVLPWVRAALVLFLWQWLCWAGLVANSSYFEFALFNYSRAVGGLGLWASLVFLTSPVASAWTRILFHILATVAAALALACHIVPGAVAFAGIFGFAVVGLVRERSVDRLVLLVMALVVGAVMYWGTSVWAMMVHVSGSDGWLPVGPPALLLLWVPVAGVAAFMLLRSLRSRPRTFPDELQDISDGLATTLLAAGSLQALTYVKMVLWGTCAPYAFKSVYYYTFPLAALWGLMWLSLLVARWLPRSSTALLDSLQRWKVPHVLTGAVALAALVLLHHLDRGLRPFVKAAGENARWRDCVVASALRKSDPTKDDGGPRYYPTRDQLPQAVATTLGQIAAEHQGWYYYDPNQPFGSFYASVVGLHLDFDTAVFCRERLASGDYAAIEACPEVRGILVPGTSDQLADPAIPGAPIGRFTEYPLAMVRGPHR